LQKGATHLFANTVVFASHPLQTSARVGEYQDKVKVVGHAPCMVELHDDKHFVNETLRNSGQFTLPRGWLLQDDGSDLDTRLESLHLRFPTVGKPVRGRGSHGVKVCHDLKDLRAHIRTLFKESPGIILEDYLAGEEATVTVMPPTDRHPTHRALPVVTRFNHVDGVAPYNGIVAVTENSRAVTSEEYAQDSAYSAIAKECESVASLLRLSAVMRIDVRRINNEPRAKFALFDVNMKPNMTGPGRPGRDNQASLTAIAAAQLGWDYPRLLCEMLQSALSLRRLREMRPENQTSAM
jgi:D-alanine-D-alanine ligase-like ATP-grasp enzyme